MSENIAEDYELLQEQFRALATGEADPLANTANFVALVYQGISRVNWAGIYVLRGHELVLGPFQGEPACVRIRLGQGVCGTAAETRNTIRIADVDIFPGHIACDVRSKSEIVVPLVANGELIGVLDVDSPEPDRFGEQDQSGIESLCRVFVRVVEGGNPGFI